MARDDEMAAITVKHVSKTFKLPHERHTSIKGALINFAKRKKGYERQRVLKDVSFEVKEGEFFGIVGRNGSGKSTLLKMLAGIYAPNEGSIDVKGRLTPFIELGVGFNPELTGRENVFLNGALLGFNRHEMEELYDGIVQFAELERFMDQRLKNYSSGMQVRLAFSIAIRAESDILLLDEVLAVGDAAFQKKCYDYFMLLKKNKHTVILVTHDMGAVRQYCDRAIMIDQGDVIIEGKPEKVAQAYQKLFADELSQDDDEQLPKQQTDESKKHWGSGKMSALKPKITVSKDIISITGLYKSNQALPSPVFGFTVNGPSGTNILEGNTLRVSYDTQPMLTGQVAEITWEIPNLFATGTYTVSVACCDQSSTEFYDWFNEAGTFKILKDGMTAGAVDPELNITNYGVNNG